MHNFSLFSSGAMRVLRAALAGLSALLFGCTSTGPKEPAALRPAYLQEFSRSFVLYADTADTAGMALLNNPSPGIGQAVRVVVHRKPGRENGVELKGATNRRIEPGDELIFTSSIRAVPPLDKSKSAEGSFAVHPDNPEQALARQAFIARQDWTPVKLTFTADRAYDKGELVVSLFSGSKAQSLEVGDARLINRGLPPADPPQVVTPIPDKPKPEPKVRPKAPSEPSPATKPKPKEQPDKKPEKPEVVKPPARPVPVAPTVTPGTQTGWREAAEARIEKIRKADFQVEILDARGRPVKGADVSLNLIRHDFSFGVAVNKRFLAKQESRDQRTYGEVITSLFNEAVMENGMKWNQWDSTAAPFLKQDTLAAFAWLQERQIQVRGHVLVWPGWNKQNPSGLDKLPAEELRQRINNHITDIVGHFRGKVHRWDVVNELRTNKDFTNVLGENAVADWFRTAHQADPNARLYYNEFGILNGPERNLVDLENTIASLRKQKAPVHGLGLQGHFNRFLPSPEQMLARLDRLAKLKLELQISEFDVDIEDEAAQAAFTKDLYTLAFSHPAVTGITSWGIWEGQHWRPQAALYRKDWKIKPNGKVVKDLLTNQWQTEVKAKSDKKGKVAGRGFAGLYEVVVRKDGQERRQSYRLSQNASPLTIKLTGTGTAPAVKPPPAKPVVKAPVKPVIKKPAPVKKTPPPQPPVQPKKTVPPPSAPPAKIPVRAPVKPEVQPKALPPPTPAEKPAVKPAEPPPPPPRRYQIRKVAPPPQPLPAETSAPASGKSAANEGRQKN